MKNDLQARLEAGLFLIDGAMGTSLQAMGLKAEDFGGFEGCNEILVHSRPDAVEAVHLGYFRAGADAVETNSFGGSVLTLAEHGLAQRSRELNRKAAELACRARATVAGDGRQRFVLGSIGPGNRLPSLGQVSFRQLLESFKPQVEGLLEGGADALLVETCQDLLQIKACLTAVREVQPQVPLLVSLTLETGGTLLSGSDLAAAVAVLEPFELTALGLNCSGGPGELRRHVEELSRLWPGRLLVMPNAGLPRSQGGRLVYDLAPADFAAITAGFAKDCGATMLGGCCGTTAPHIKALAEALAGLRPGVVTKDFRPSAASLFGAVTLAQEPAPLVVGERCNVNGSKDFKEKLLAGDLDGQVATARDQERCGAHVLDLSLGFPGRDEVGDLKALMPLLVARVKAPLMVDSTSPEAMEAALELHPGRCLLNSVNLEAGVERLQRVARLARRHGAVLVALAIDEEGMALTAPRKLAVAERILDLCKAEGLREADLVFDMLTFTVASGPDSAGAALATLTALEEFKRRHPACHTVLGVSNVSYGLAPAARRVLNSVFLHEALARGLSSAIVNAGKIVVLGRLPQPVREAARALLLAPDQESWKGSMEAFLGLVGGLAQKRGADREVRQRSSEEALREAILDGEPGELEQHLEALLAAGWDPKEILNKVLLEAMKEVGRLFGAGLMQLPFVLQSAEVMRRASRWLEGRMEKSGQDSLGGVVIATVKGDVHDIGKNLVAAILANNGYEVTDLGVRVDASRMVEEIKAKEPLALGMSGLLVRSAEFMKENLEEFRRKGVSVPVLVGGAALNEAFVREVLAPAYGAPVFHCPDAFAALRVLEALREGSQPPQAQPGEPRPAYSATVAKGRSRVASSPRQGVAEYQLGAEDLLGALDQRALLSGRWRLRKGALSAEEHQRLIEDRALPLLAEFKAELLQRGLLHGRAVAAHFPCRQDGGRLLLKGAAGEETFSFQASAGIPELYADGPGFISAFVATIGPGVPEFLKTLYAQDRYRDWLLLAGLGAGLAEAAAELMQARLCEELRPHLLGEDPRPQFGRRVSFGYPCCPDLANQRGLFRLLSPERIGVALTEGLEMDPEFSVSALLFVDGGQ